MRKIFFFIMLLVASNSFAQSNDELLKHFEEYYKEMKLQGDIQGVINGLTHLNIIKPSQGRRDTLALIYMSEGRYRQALNTIGLENKPTDSEIAIEVKAVSLKAMNELERATVFFEKLFKIDPSVSIAYELAECYLQINQLEKAKTYTKYGFENSGDDLRKNFYEGQQPYQVPLKAAFLHIDALITFNENKESNIDSAVDILDEALKLAPHFRLAQLSKSAILSQKSKTDKD